MRCLEIRKRICPVFGNVVVDEDAAAKDLPLAGVPEAFLEHAVHLPEADRLRTTMPGPASRPPDVSEEQDVEEEDGDDSCHEETGEEQEGVQELIAVDPQFDPKPAQLFNALSHKMELVHQEAQKVADQSFSSASTVADATRVAAEEGCRRLVIDVQDVVFLPGGGDSDQDASRSSNDAHTQGGRDEADDPEGDEGGADVDPDAS